ncbi:hypothetical protein TTHERM_00313060 (macronuclear) [Tetrahymena thermophila SB210]|uniref:Kinase domain protein n=1 Tax=Tetrahymena thermophila (strain SB210) TaxID=312017 RepID=Q22KH5_TETTS|nr:hypothetical protein TTHERM_00313060 [Tetrahymena thermophila SB210]EAR85824.2 hypothetical protein TTHERM_00313060 [Tetrahymena thermophila SB210]|eukprot:XP_001033487.2 hypothetical protein TTHERM_00313060 [Tetrahymena thermophila SB210]
MEMEIEEIQDVLKNRNKLEGLQKCDIQYEDIQNLASHFMKFNQNLEKIQLDSYNLTSIVLKALNNFDNSYVAICVCNIKKISYSHIATKTKKLGINFVSEHIFDDRLLYQIFEYNQYLFACKTLGMSQINEQNFNLVKSALVQDQQVDQDLLEIINNQNVVEKLQKCLKLEKLNLDLNFLEMNQKYIYSILNIDILSSNLIDLKIGLIQSGIQDFIVKEIAEALFKYNKLQNLDLLLSLNPISEKSIYMILNTISQLNNLENLVLDLYKLQKPISIMEEDNQERQQNQLQIENSIKNLKIDLSCNQYLSSNSFQDFINISLSCTKSLTDFYLDLSKNPISNEVFCSIIKDLSQQTQLRSLNLRLVDLKINFDAFKDCFVKLTEVESFVIQLDKSIPSCINLFEELLFLKKLKHLEVSTQNKHSITQHSNISSILRKMNTLQSFVLNFNSSERTFQQIKPIQRLKGYAYYECLKLSYLVSADLLF